MKLWPYDSFEIRTQLSAESIAAVLNDHIEPRKWFRLSTSHKAFEGTFTPDGFKVTRIMHYRNSFLPVITGSFRPKPPGTNIIIRMRLHSLVSAFMCVWFGGVALFLVLVFAAVFTGRAVQYPLFLIPFGMLLFGWAMVSGAFWFEAKKAESLLLELFNRRPRSPSTTISA